MKHTAITLSDEDWGEVLICLSTKSGPRVASIYNSIATQRKAQRFGTTPAQEGKLLRCNMLTGEIEEAPIQPHDCSHGAPGSHY
jgi:hypothetical protein